MDRKGFFKTIFGGFVAASTAPPLLKAEESPQSPKENESASSITIHKPKDDPWKRDFMTIR